MIADFFALFKTDAFLGAFNFLWTLLPIWLPLLLLALWFDLWVDYKRRGFIKAQGSILLEIKLPQQMLKSPQAMELFLNNLYNIFPGNLIKVYAEGGVRPWWSLELVSIDGNVHFFIWAHKKFQSMLESQLYAQFPNIEVHEVPDYTLGVQHDPDRIKFGWFGQIGLTKPDAYPIQTYIEYGLDKMLGEDAEAYKVDPMVALLEYLGSLKRGEQAWVQILIQGHAKEGLKFGRIFTKPDWRADVDKEIKKIIKEARFKPEGDQPPSSLHLSKDQQQVIAAIERSISKTAFDTMIRVTYFAENEVFNPNNIGGLLGSFRQFSSNTLNGFKPIWHAGYDYPFQDFRGRKKMVNERRILEAYKRRSFFNTPFRHFHGKPFILTTEELATLFHFPSAAVAATPTISRVPSKRAEAPANLPV
ncbi:MAG: hypothetical protein Q8O98_02440 [bacterium]|nr:hypothetical protein [bacterium]